MDSLNELYKTYRDYTKRTVQNGGGRYDFFQILWYGNQAGVAFRSYIIFSNSNIPNFHSPLKFQIFTLPFKSKIPTLLQN